MLRGMAGSQGNALLKGMCSCLLEIAQSPAEVRSLSFTDGETESHERQSLLPKTLINSVASGKAGQVSCLLDGRAVSVAAGFQTC